MHRIEVGLKKGVVDPRGEAVKKRVRNELGLDVDVRTINVFSLNFGLPDDIVKLVAEDLFRDTVIEIVSVDKPLDKDFDFIVEKGFKPGVTDNVGKTAKKNIEFLLDKKLEDHQKVFSSVQFLIKGNVTRDQVQEICSRILGNELIENFTISDKLEFEHPMPLVAGLDEHRIETFNLNLSDYSLIELSANRCLALSLEEMHAIKEHFNDSGIQAVRNEFGLSRITDVELEVLAQTWSEHCKHKEFNARVQYVDRETGEEETIDSLFSSYIKAATRKIREILGKKDYMIKVFNDNAGIVKYNQRKNLVFKVETHNSPSALDPYGGAITGIVGVNRDPAGTGRTGAKPLFNTNIFCFANPFYNKPLPPNTLHPMQVFEGVHRGVRDGGNQSGIPTLNGSLFFDDRYAGKPLVYCGTGGLMPAEVDGKDNSEKEILAGYYAIMLGGRVGKDGIHGATMSSEHRHKGTPVSAVQIGDPITQKVMLDFIWEIKDKGWITAITDNGAGGLSSSLGELARISNGIEIDLLNVPVKYLGLKPWEIFVSESQERMSIVVPEEHLQKVLDYAHRRDVEASIVGQFNNSGYLSILLKDKYAALIDLEFLHNGVPEKEIIAEWDPPGFHEPDLEEPEVLLDELKLMLSSLNVCSKEYIVRPYDHEVKGGTVVKPLSGIKNDGPSDASVIAPEHGEYSALVIAHGLCPRYSDIDAYHMSACAFDEMVRNIVAVGGQVPDLEKGIVPVWSVNDNFCCPDSLQGPDNPDGKHKFANLVRANKALYNYSTKYLIPCTSGKDSMKNDFTFETTEGKKKISVPLTLLYSGVCRIEDYRKCVTIDAKKAGDFVYVLGKTFDELGGSEYYNMKGFLGRNVPKVDAERALRLYRGLNAAMQEELVESCHDCSDGGLAVALAETAFSGGLGMDIDLRKVPTECGRNDKILFSESQSRFVVTVSAKNSRRFEEIMHNNCFSKVGNVTDVPVFRIWKLDGKSEMICLKELKHAWQKPLRFDLPLEELK